MCDRVYPAQLVGETCRIFDARWVEYFEVSRVKSFLVSSTVERMETPCSVTVGRRDGWL